MKIHHQNVFDIWPLEDKSIQAVITSPPYWALRKYDIPDVVIGDWKGQFGLEPTYQEYIEHMRLWAKEAWRVLKDDGVMFINLGDSYGGSWGNYGDRAGNQRSVNEERFEGKGRESGLPQDLRPPSTNAKSKCKLLIPHRMAIALIDDGWVLRNDIIWSKLNAMPESCKDRFSKKFEYIFMFTKKTKYYFDLDAIRMKYSLASHNRASQNNGHPVNNAPKMRKGGRKTAQTMDPKNFLHSKGKNPGDVWSFTTQFSPEKHYAMWPEKLVERMILCSTRPGDTVLDPFCGSGTTLRVSDQLNRKGIGIDLGYEEIQKRRLSNIQKELL